MDLIKLPVTQTSIKGEAHTSAYIGVTSREWFTYLTEENWQGEVNFWTKKITPLRRLSIGDPFFFLVKNDKGVKGERFVKGVAFFERFEVLTLVQAWDSYKEGNGDPSSLSFYTRMQEMFGEIEDGEKIGCLILSNMQVFDKPVLLSEIGINFKKSIVSRRYAGKMGIF